MTCEEFIQLCKEHGKKNIVILTVLDWMMKISIVMVMEATEM